MSHTTSNIVFEEPKPKEGVMLCMNVEEYVQNDALAEFYGQTVYEVECTNCISKGSKNPRVSATNYLPLLCLSGHWLSQTAHYYLEMDYSKEKRFD